MYLIAVIVLFLIIGTYFVVSRSPEGWEDNKGFHKGKPK